MPLKWFYNYREGTIKLVIELDFNLKIDSNCLPGAMFVEPLLTYLLTYSLHTAESFFRS
jgi:hypothetical protein